VRRALLSLLLPCALAGAQTPSGGHAEYQPQGSIREYFLRAWKLVSTENKYPDGHTNPYPDLGADAIGFLLYTPSGHMCAQLMKPGRPRWADKNTPTTTEAVSALNGFTSYCGTFEIRESERTILHHPETAWSPNWPGTVQKRPYYLVSQDRFYFRGVDSERQKNGTEKSVTWTITWERLK
jgi:hypothetical protein